MTREWLFAIPATKRPHTGLNLRPIAYIAIGALTLAVGQSAGRPRLSRRWRGILKRWDGMGGGYMGGMGQSNGTRGGCRGQGQSSTGAQNSSPQQAVTTSTNTSVNDPATVLAHQNDLNLTSQQVQRLEKMLSSGKQRASLVLTNSSSFRWTNVR